MGVLNLEEGRGIEAYMSVYGNKGIEVGSSGSAEPLIEPIIEPIIERIIEPIIERIIEERAQYSG